MAHPAIGVEKLGWKSLVHLWCYRKYLWNVLKTRHVPCRPWVPYCEEKELRVSGALEGVAFDAAWNLVNSFRPWSLIEVWQSTQHNSLCPVHFLSFPPCWINILSFLIAIFKNLSVKIVHKKLCFKYFSGHTAVSVIVSWFMDISTHEALGSLSHRTDRLLLFYTWVSCAEKTKKKVLLLTNISKRCRMKSAFVHHQSYWCNTNLSISVMSRVIVYSYYERRLFAFT